MMELLKKGFLILSNLHMIFLQDNGVQIISFLANLPMLMAMEEPILLDLLLMEFMSR